MDPAATPTERVASAAECVEILLAQLKPAIAARSYGIIVGEDTSGRVPLLLLAGAINTHYARIGQPRIDVMFLKSVIAWDGTPEFETMRQAFEARRHILDRAPRGSRALIVSDKVNSGSSAGNIGKFLTAAGFEFDIATINASARLEEYQEAGVLPTTTRLYTASAPFLMLHRSVYQQVGMSGLNRSKLNEGRAVLRDPEIRRTVVETRHAIRAQLPRLGAGLD